MLATSRFAVEECPHYNNDCKDDDAVSTEDTQLFALARCKSSLDAASLDELGQGSPKMSTQRYDA